MMMMMNDQQIFVSWRHHPLYIPFPFHFPPINMNNKPSTLAVVVSRRSRATVVQSCCCLLEQQQQQQQEEQEQNQMTAKEKRELRNEKREVNKSYNWREEVEEKLLQKPKKQFNSWKEELNLDKLAVLGPQWWILKVSRAKGKDTVERLMQSLHKNFPDSEFKVFTAAINEKNKLKNGKISVKPKPLYPGCVFLNCILNRELHNFIKEDCEGVGGFVGRMVGNTKRQINKPRPVSEDDMEAIFQEVKEKQEASDKAFEEKEEHLGAVESDNKKTLSLSDKKKLVTKRRTRKPSGPLLGSNVRILSGTFSDFSGTIKKLDKKRGLATVGFTLFGKETIADLKLIEIAEEQN